MKILKRLRKWWLHRKIHKACQRARLRVSKMSPEERKKLNDGALRIMFPDGYFTCESGHKLIYVANGEKCPFCGTSITRHQL